MQRPGWLLGLVIASDRFNRVHTSFRGTVMILILISVLFRGTLRQLYLFFYLGHNHWFDTRVVRFWQHFV